MNKIYVLVPLIGLLVFGGFYYQFEKGFNERAAVAKAQAAADLKAKQIKENAAREKAVVNAIAAAAQRKAEREEKDRIEEAKKKARLDAEDHRQHVFDERNRLRDQVRRLKGEVDEVKADITKLELEKKHSVSELAFQEEIAKKAEANQKYYYDLVDKIAAADAAAAKAAAEAAAIAAAKAKS
jgi:colicin import membrane protein